jgi:hypothetical protein
MFTDFSRLMILHDILISWHYWEHFVIALMIFIADV